MNTVSEFGRPNPIALLGPFASAELALSKGAEWLTAEAVWLEASCVVLTAEGIWNDDGSDDPSGAAPALAMCCRALCLRSCMEVSCGSCLVAKDCRLGAAAAAAA